MAALDTSVNLFALLDGNDPGDKRLADFDSQQKEKKKDKAGAAKKQPANTVVPDYKLKLMKLPSTPAPAASSRAPWKTPAPAVAAGLRSAAATSMARAMNKQGTTTAPADEPPARSTNFTALLFGKAYPSARERIFKQRLEEYERRQAQAKAMMNDAGVTGDDGKSAAAVAPPAGKTHGARVQLAGRGGTGQAGATVKEASVQAAPPASKGKDKVVDGGKQRQGITVYEAAAPLKPLTPPPGLEDMDQFPSLK